MSCLEVKLVSRDTVGLGAFHLVTRGIISVPLFGLSGKPFWPPWSQCRSELNDGVILQAVKGLVKRFTIRNPYDPYVRLGLRSSTPWHYALCRGTNTRQAAAIA